MEVLTLSQVSKSFGTKKVVEDLNLNLEEHKIFGFVGQNGAGKTTTMKMILGLLRPDRGEIFVNGQKVCFGQTGTSQSIGYLPDVPEFYGFMTPREYLELCGKMAGMPVEKRRDKVEELLHLVGLFDSNKRIQGFSRGMKQRLGIAQALLGDPVLLLCDEPTSALDPLGRKEILDILSDVKKHTTVLFSTHILSDVERICDEIAFLHKGRIALQGTIEEVKGMGKNKGSEIEVEFYQEQEADEFSAYFSRGRKKQERVLHFENQEKQNMFKMMQYLTEHQVAVQRMEVSEPTLEDLFLEVIGK
ncbi:MAG: ABC transporter ATP-binding protein [Lachnospiraceae bacterium]|nr:ABC transporter ATP-binding protein [Lachnospiraceae bacterium]